MATDEAYFDDPTTMPPPTKVEAFQTFLKKVIASRGTVSNSTEFQRILGLPRRELDVSAEVAEAVTAVVRAPGGTMTLWPLQAAALVEAARADGLFAPMAVGVGKSLVTLLLPTAMDSQRAVLLMPGHLKRKTLREIDDLYRHHFVLPLDRITIVTFDELSSAKQHDILDRIKPDLIIIDECHGFSRKESARTKRFMRHAKANPGCRYAFLSGTITSTSILNYAHLIELVLRKNSPLPSGYHEVRDWAGALDVEPQYEMMPGVLKQFCAPGESVRSGYRRRLVETLGVVASGENELGTSLVIRRRAPEVPREVEALLKEVRDKWCLEDEVFDSPLAQMRVLRQIAVGHYLKWAWPNGVKDYDWLEARAAWNKDVRDQLKRSTKGMDSPLLCAQAAAAGRFKAASWGPWATQKQKPPPPTEVVWVSDFAVEAALAWGAASADPGIIWYEHKALGERIATIGGVPHYGAGTDASPSREALIVASLRSQGEGKNLQHFQRNLLTSLPPNGKTLEQVIGRTHRPGQRADEVVFDWWGHTDETAHALAEVIEDAKYIEQTLNQRQKVLYATQI